MGLVSLSGCVHNTLADRAAALYPTAIRSPVLFCGPPEPLRVRVYVEEAFRSQTLEWAHRVRSELEAASLILREDLGVSLELERFEAWPSDAGHERDIGLERALRALERLDAGEDVDLVIGYVASQPLAVLSIHEVGIASLVGRHLVIRQLDDAEEYKRLQELLSGSLVDRINPLYNARLAHKEQVVLLHEIGHALGAIHAVDGTDLMNALYDPAMSHLGAWNREAIRISLSARGEARGDPERREASLNQLRAHLDSADPEIVDRTDIATLKRLLGADRAQLSRASDRVLRAPTTPEQQQAPKINLRERFNSLVKNNDARSLEVARQLALEEPQSAEIGSIACEQERRWAPTSSQAVSACQRALSLTPTSARSRLDLADIWMAQGDTAAAFRVSIEAAEHLGRASGGFANDWRHLSWIFGQLNAPTPAEAAAAHSEDPSFIASTQDWAQRLWSRLELGPKRPPPAREREYIGARLAIEAQVNQGKITEAEQANTELRAAFPNFPDASLTLCAHFYTKRSLPKVKEHCGRAASLDLESSRPRMLLGAAKVGGGDIAGGIKDVEAALACPNSTKDMWKFLRGLYQATGAKDRAKSLENRYQTRFGEPL